MSDICNRGRSPVARPADNKVVLVTGNSMPGNYSRISRFTPSKVYEIDPRDGRVYKSDGGAILGFDSGWYAWAPDGISRESIMPYMAQLAVDAGHAPSISLLNMGQGGTDLVDWVPGGALWNRMTTALATLSQAGVVPDLHIHYGGCWEAVKGYSFAGCYGLMNFFLDECHRARPSLRVKVAKRTYHASADPSVMSAVWAGMYQAICDRDAAGMKVSAGPDDDICLADVADSVHFIDNSRFHVCQQWVPHFAGI